MSKTTFPVKILRLVSVLIKKKVDTLRPGVQPGKLFTRMLASVLSICLTSSLLSADIISKRPVEYSKIQEAPNVKPHKASDLASQEASTQLKNHIFSDGYEKVYAKHFTKIQGFEEINVFHYPLGRVDIKIDTEYLEKKAKEQLRDLFPYINFGHKPNKRGNKNLSGMNLGDALSAEQKGQINISIFTRPFLSKINIFYLVEAGNYVAFHDDIYEEVDMMSLNRKHLTFELGIVVDNSMKTFGKMFYLARRDTLNDFYTPITPVVP